MLPFVMKSAPQPSLPLNSCLPGASYLPNRPSGADPLRQPNFVALPAVAGPLFSYSYKSLFPQPSCFHIHTKPRGCHPPDISVRDLGPLCPPCLCGKSYILSSLPPVLPLFALFKKVNSFAIKQIQPLFAKHRGGGTPAQPRRALLPPSYASRAASIPCGLSRLRILPVTTGVCTPNLPNRHSSLATCPVPPLLSQPPFARFLYPAYTSKARRTTPCSACKHFAPKCVRPCAWRCRWSLPRLAG